VDDLPIDAQLKGSEVTAVPYDNSGVRIGFDLDKTKAATVTLRDADGHPLPAGLNLASADGGVKVQVAKGGFAQVDGIGAEPARVAGEVGSRRFECEIPAPRVAELLPDLGEVTCR
jgi:outer membrane usher protein